MPPNANALLDAETKLDCAEKGIPRLVSAIDFLDDVIPTADLLILKRILRRAKQRQKLLRMELMG
jgi:hypothetical protein